MFPFTITVCSSTTVAGTTPPGYGTGLLLLLQSGTHSTLVTGQSFSYQAPGIVSVTVVASPVGIGSTVCYTPVT